jgi:hypothetical protein
MRPGSAYVAAVASHEPAGALPFREAILELRLVVQERSLTRHLLLPEFREVLDA